ncbi:MAG: replication-associated recombination protein A, partial [Deltaproteobacteria bacterium]|nr:replication-associated recombination protein A [Deltaproteobacteria bacterium]
ALLAAREDARTQGALPVPLHLRNAPTELMQELGYGAGYQYPHDFPDAAVAQDFLPERLRNRRYYEPTDRGYELVVRRRMAAHRRHAAGSQSDRVGKEPRD